jgi:outer membrane immunogenic protein
LATALLSSTALAADLPTRKEAPAFTPPPAAVTWTGFYIGVNGGYAGDQFKYPYSVAGLVSGSANLTSSGFVVGGQAGYNYQFAPSWVGGIETDIDFADVKGRIGINGSGSGFGFSASGGTKTDYLGTVRARLGYLITDRFLVFATGGFAYGDAKTTANLNFGGPLFNYSKTNTLDGWTIGGGVEYMIAPNWTFKTEYLYADLGTGTIASGTIGGTAYSVKVHPTDNIVRAGLNYKFF